MSLLILDNRLTRPMLTQNVFVESVVITNRSGLPERYAIQASGDSWLTTPSVDLTPIVGGNESYELLLFMTPTLGVQNSYVLTVTTQSNPENRQVLIGTVTAGTGAVLTATKSQIPQTITHTVQLTNSGDLPDSI